MILTPNSWGALREYNTCHHPGGSGKGGQFADRGVCGTSGPVTETPEFKAWFGDSVVTNADGSPRVMYHSTGANPEYFRPFTHFGTAKAANDRFDTLHDFSVNTVGREAAKTQVVPVYLSIKNPLRMPDLASVDQFGETLPDNWDDYSGGDPKYPLGWEGEGSVATILYQMDEITRDEFWDVQYNNDKAFRLLMRKGYDGIVYKNDVEDAGNDSYIIFKASQAKSALANLKFDRRKARMVEVVR
jgi:hypothetical protein